METLDDKSDKIITYYHKTDNLESDTDGESINLTIDDNGKVVVIKYDKIFKTSDINMYTTNVLSKGNEELENVRTIKDKLHLTQHLHSDLKEYLMKPKRKKSTDQKAQDIVTNDIIKITPEPKHNNREQRTSDKQKFSTMYHKCKSWASKVAKKVSSYYYVLVSNWRESDEDKNTKKNDRKRPIKTEDNDDEKNARKGKKSVSKTDVEEKRRIDYLNAALKIADF